MKFGYFDDAKRSMSSHLLELLILGSTTLELRISFHSFQILREVIHSIRTHVFVESQDTVTTMFL